MSCRLDSNLFCFWKNLEYCISCWSDANDFSLLGELKKIVLYCREKMMFGRFVVFTTTLVWTLQCWFHIITSNSHSSHSDSRFQIPRWIPTSFDSRFQIPRWIPTHFDPRSPIPSSIPTHSDSRSPIPRCIPTHSDPRFPMPSSVPGVHDRPPLWLGFETGFRTRVRF